MKTSNDVMKTSNDVENYMKMSYMTIILNTCPHGALDSQPHDGGGDCGGPPPSNLAPRRYSEKRRKVFESSSQIIIESMMAFFFAKVNIYVTEVIKVQI